MVEQIPVGIMVQDDIPIEHLEKPKTYWEWGKELLWC